MLYVSYISIFFKNHKAQVIESESDPQLNKAFHRPQIGDSNAQKKTEDANLQGEMEVCAWKGRNTRLCVFRKIHREIPPSPISGSRSRPHKSWDNFFSIMYIYELVVVVLLPPPKKRKKKEINIYNNKHINNKKCIYMSFCSLGPQPDLSTIRQLTSY